MMARKNSFGLYGMVAWTDDVPIEVLEEHGEGPFPIVGVELLPDEKLAANPDVHPEMVTIKLPNGKRRDFTGDWFQRVEATA